MTQTLPSAPAICAHCQHAVRRDGLQLVSNVDDLIACPEAPMETCSHCSGKGCGSCEGYGEVYGRHAETSPRVGAAGCIDGLVTVPTEDGPQLTACLAPCCMQRRAAAG
jgi:hypothetical protein